MASNLIPYKHLFPSKFKRLLKHNPYVEHLEKLTKNRVYRRNQKIVLVQGLKVIKDIRDHGVPIKSIGVTAELDPVNEDAIKYPANEVLRNPDLFPAENYYLATIDVTRKILGTEARPAGHELWAEVPFPQHPFPEKKQLDRVLVLDKVNDPISLGMLVQTARALGWRAGWLNSGTVDLYHDKAVRGSLAATLWWPTKTGQWDDLRQFLDEYELTPMLADVERKNGVEELSTREEGKEGEPHGLKIWNWPAEVERKMPERVALVVSSLHPNLWKDEIPNDFLRVSVPTVDANRLSSPIAGGLLMYEINRILAAKEKGPKAV
ncbi:hypothetical protein BC937DRAFT_93087 [Endogone sp. FLAS-F59071]|nr:hypothetical protein BC937DRAFT_93087 [Endogone sp. FLAS-F59071]|eukprot:RUS21305.1 hypothetical protein BC937DRAFT_93087 [Endogone sp. FLAS-F59071]